MFRSLVCRLRVVINWGGRNAAFFRGSSGLYEMHVHLVIFLGCFSHPRHMYGSSDPLILCFSRSTSQGTVSKPFGFFIGPHRPLDPHRGPVPGTSPPKPGEHRHFPASHKPLPWHSWRWTPGGHRVDSFRIFLMKRGLAEKRLGQTRGWGCQVGLKWSAVCQNNS